MLENLSRDSIAIMFDKPDFDGAIRAAHKEAKIRFLDIVDHLGFELSFVSFKADYNYSLDQTIYYYYFKIVLR